MRPRKVPMRKCVVCQQMSPKKDLIRLVRTPDNEVHIDTTGKMSGRGAYVCKRESCTQDVQKHRALDRALKQTLSAEIYEQLAGLHDE